MLKHLQLSKILLFVELLCCQLVFLVCAYFLKCRDFCFKSGNV
jgi:hypothetical protein